MSKYYVTYELLNRDQSVSVTVEAADENEAASKGTVAMFNDDFDINQINLISVQKIEEDKVKMNDRFEITYIEVNGESRTGEIYACHIGDALYSYLLEHSIDGVEIVAIEKIC